MTSVRELAKAKLLLLVYSGYECKLDEDIWVLCNKTLYKSYLADELVGEGHFTKENNSYSASTKHLIENQFKL